MFSINSVWKGPLSWVLQESLSCQRQSLWPLLVRPHCPNRLRSVCAGPSGRHAPGRDENEPPPWAGEVPWRERAAAGAATGFPAASTRSASPGRQQNLGRASRPPCAPSLHHSRGSCAGWTPQRPLEPWGRAVSGREPLRTSK